MSLPWQPLNLDLNNRLLTLALADGSVSLAFAPSLQAEGHECRLQNATVEAPAGELPETLDLPLRFHTPPLDWTLHLQRADEGRTLLISSTIHNPGPDPVKLGECRLVEVLPDHGSLEIAGDDGNAVFLNVSGTTGPTRVKRADSGEENMSRTLLQLVSNAAGRALHLGFATYDRMETVHRFTYEGDGVKSLKAVCDFQDHVLAPGQSIQSETLMIQASDDLHESLHSWADRVAAHYQPHIWPKTTGGWLGWSWVDPFHTDTYEETVLRNCRAIRRRLAGFDIEYVWVSIGNIAGGYPGNWLEWDYTNFPSGPECIIRELNDLGFKLGFWCGAFWVCEGAKDKMVLLADATLRKDGKPAVAAPHWNYGVSATLPLDQRPAIYSLDPTNPKARDFIANVYETYRQWGIRYFMVDFINAIAYPNEGIPYDEHYDESVIRGAELLRAGLKIVRDVAGPDTYLLSSSGPNLQNVGLMDACRMGNDYGEGRAINPESYFYPASFVINGANFWTSHSYASGNMAGYYYTHRKLFVNDSANVMTLDKPVPVCEAQIVATIFGMCGGPVMLGDDIDRISEERLALIKKVFPRTPEIATPVDLFDRPLPDYPRVFHNHVKTEWGEWEVVSVLNYDDEPLTLPIPLERLSLPEGERCRVFEFWNEQYLGTISGELRAIVPPRSARVYRLSRYTGYPWVLGTDMHVMQGQVELADVRWDRDTMTLSVTATRPVGETGTVFVAAPKGLAVTNPAGYHIAKDAHDESLVITKQMTFGEGAEGFEVRFKVYDEEYAMEELDLR
ncbi:MAG: hypothetical protein ABFE08_05095 [Armatimonadia bacterium]